ncbi:hypothetical protein P3550_09825 [Vibrio parahaemolyticus]|nr:hypothetical protein [Vibrio parahaemolyticus]
MTKLGVLLATLISSFAYANDVKITHVSNGFTLNNMPASTIYLCSGNEQDCVQFTFNSASLSSLLESEVVTNKRSNNPDLSVSANWGGEHYVISDNHSTIWSGKLESHNESTKSIAIKYNMAIKSTTTDKYITLKNVFLHVVADDYDTLLSISKERNSLAANSSIVKGLDTRLSDCEYSKLMIDEASPLLIKAVSFVGNTDYREIAQWRTTVFNSSISQIENKYRISPTEAMSANRSLSTQIHNDFVNRTRLLVQEIYNHVRNGGDKSAIQEQWQIIKKTGELYAQQCEQPKKAENTPKAKPTKLLVKMSNTGVCHSPSSSWYNRTKNYTTYQSIESCIANGGRLPKK